MFYVWASGYKGLPENRNAKESFSKFYICVCKLMTRLWKSMWKLIAIYAFPDNSLWALIPLDFYINFIGTFTISLKYCYFPWENRNAQSVLQIKCIVCTFGWSVPAKCGYKTRIQTYLWVAVIKCTWNTGKIFTALLCFLSNNTIADISQITKNEHFTPLLAVVYTLPVEHRIGCRFFKYNFENSYEGIIEYNGSI